MNHKDIIRRLHLTYQYLNDKRLKNALDLIADAVKDTHRSDLIDTHYNIEMTYKSLLRFTVEGFTDSGRQEIYNQLISDIFIFADNVYDELLTRFGEGYFYELIRKVIHSGVSFETVADSYFEQLTTLNLLEESGSDVSPVYPEISCTSYTVFEHILTQQIIGQSETETLTRLFGANEVPWTQQAVFTTAITIQLLHRFNIKGIDFLYSLAEHHPNMQIKQRALVGLLLALYKYDSRLRYYPEIVERLKTIRENQPLLNIVKTVIIQFLRTYDTENIVRRLTDEIIPEVAKIHPNLRNRLDLDNILGDNFKEGKNPDWEKIFSDSPELMSKLEEFTKLQMEGADTFMSTFRLLKNFTFFNNVAHWFLPFFYPNPIVDDILKNENETFRNQTTLERLADSPIMCNSDKYSFILSIPKMPAGQKEIMGQMFLAEIDAIRDLDENDKLIDTNMQTLSISNRYIQDLYRFYKLNPHRNSFIDPFSWTFDFYNKWFINELFPNDDLLNRLGEYLFEKDRYKEASEVFEILSKRTDNNLSMQLLQKHAYCLQQLQNCEEALQLYLKADLYKHGQVWNLKKIALCYRYLKNPEKAVEYYKEAERTQPDNLHTQVSIGHCLLEMKDYAEALKYYFKVEYLDPKNKKVWRPITWCSLALGKLEQAEKYAMKNIDAAPAQSDFLNMGHIKWCMGNRLEALEWYQKCVKFEGNTITDFLDSFENDRQLLLDHNVNSADIPIMIDQLRYYLEN
ncbi:MAG: tetratricopeptide repeat protein [Cytophagaceae bacterium]|jgi:tetratricopeptide (TPR) repeat protein|nr:tetratricopeptide repeat protein [Cytophagaceae bacterium]